jgi:GNAT superfamily N-acetyltransferase
VTGVAIRLACPEEIDALVAIDDDACTLDAEAGLSMAFDASHPFVVDERARWVAAIAARLLEVAETPDGTLAGFPARGVVDGEPYLDQLSVRRAWMRQGIGTSLLRRAIAWSTADSSSRLWLTTWTHVPWNAPFYARDGFVAHPEAVRAGAARDPAAPARGAAGSGSADRDGPLGRRRHAAGKPASGHAPRRGRT